MIMFTLLSLMHYSLLICNLNGVMKTMDHKKNLNNYRLLSYNNIEIYPFACARGNNNNNNNNNYNNNNNNNNNDNNNNNTNYSIINYYDDYYDNNYDNDNNIQNRISIRIVLLLLAFIAHIDMNNFIWQTRKTNTYYHYLY